MAARSTTTDTHQSTPPDIREPPPESRDSATISTSSTTFRTRPTGFFNIKRLGAGIIADIRTRAPWYLSDWTDAWNYRVIPATTLTFFANVLPGIAFSLDLIETTEKYGVAEVLVASFMAAFIFSVFGAQPLTIAGVTGPITVFNKTIFDTLNRKPNRPNYLQFIGWVYFWGAIFHWITAILNLCSFLKYVTLFSCDTFGFYVSWVYLQYGVQVLTRQFVPTDLPGAQGVLVSIILAILMLFTCFLFQSLSQTPYFHKHARRLFVDYGMPISLVAASAMAYWGRFNGTNPPTLPISGAFQAAGGRQWLIRFWELEGMWVGMALPFGIVLWILFLFDHNVSSLMAQRSEFPLRKPPGFHYDFFLLGVTTFIAGLIGVPAPNGLIPQAPIHTTSLLVMGRSRKHEKDEEDRASRTRIHTRSSNDIPRDSDHPDPITASSRHDVPVAVVEQRVSNLAQGSLSLVLLTGPFLHVLHLIPRGVLAGLFWYMGADALRSNGITKKVLYLIKDKTLTSKQDPLNKVRKSRILLFVGVQLIGFGATFAITQTIAAIGFPILIMLLLPIRTMIIPRMSFTREELAILDGPTASAFTMKSVGGGSC